MFVVLQWAVCRPRHHMVSIKIWALNTVSLRKAISGCVK